MGAYGSPDLRPNNSSYTYGNYQKPKSEKGGCLKNGLIAVGVLLVFFVVYGIATSMINGGSPRKKDNAVQAMASAPMYSMPVDIPPVPVSSAPVSSAPAPASPSSAVHKKPQISSTQSYYENPNDESITECMTEAEAMTAWAESIVRLSLKKPERAQFYKDGSKWKISNNKDFYEISSDVLYAENPRTYNTFTIQAVRDGPDITVIYYKLGNKVVTDNRKKQ